VCESFGARLREFNGEGDHVHLLVHYPPKAALSKLVNSLKGVSSRYLRAQYTGRINQIGTGSVLWSPSYFAGSRGGAPPSPGKSATNTRTPCARSFANAPAGPPLLCAAGEAARRVPVRR